MKFGSITIESRIIIIPIVVGGRTLDSYQINAGESSMTLTQWVDQLRDKRWFTPELETDFIHAYNYIQSLPK